MGVGGGGLLVIYLTAIKGIPQLAAQGINLLFFLPSAFVSVLLQLKELKNNKKLLLLICTVGTLASLFASLFVGKLSEGFLKRGFGVLLVLAGVYGFFKGGK